MYADPAPFARSAATPPSLKALLVGGDMPQLGRLFPGIEWVEAADLDEAEHLAAREAFDCVVLGVIPSGMEGRRVLERLDPALDIIVVEADTLSLSRRLTEIAEHRRLRRDKAMLEAELTAISADLERTQAALAGFMLAASHDLMAPLQTIEGFADLMGQAVSSADRRHVGYIREAAVRARRLIVALHDYAGHTCAVPVIATVDPATVLAEVQADLRDRFAAAGGSVEIGPLPPVAGDAHLLAVVFRRLLDNCLTFRSETPLRVRIEGRVSGRGVEITVTDNGIGFDPAFAESVFEPLRRLHPPTERPGAGLGLTACRRIVEVQQGAISTDAVPGRGCRVTLHLPAAAVAKAA